MSVVMGEVTAPARVRTELLCAVPGVVRAHEAWRGSRRLAVQERLYECANGYALGARRGGPLHLADEHTWEIFTLSPERFAIGNSVGWVDDPTLERVVRLLANWPSPEATQDAATRG